MGVISSSSFDPLRRYVRVRLQQGVPIVDADWNEMDDIHHFELQAFLKWFIGDGVPEGNNSFRIASIGQPNDFLVTANVTGPLDGLNNVGRFLINGLDVFITTDIKFTDQPLHEDNKPSPTRLAASMNGGAISGIDKLKTSSAAAYLDVWERLVPPTEDPSLILAGLGTESCARIKREWVVRVRDGNTTPAPGDADYIPGHNYSLFCTFVRHTDNTPIATADITDRRTTRLTLATLIERVSLLERVTLIPAFDPLPAAQFSPPSGVIGNTITLHGRNFLLGRPRVFFGDVEAMVLGAANSNSIKGFELTANVPPGVVTNARLRVQTEGGVAVSDSTFGVIGAPTFSTTLGTQVTPPSGLQGQQVTLTGTNFNGSNLKVEFVSLINGQSLAPQGTPTVNTAGTQIVVVAPNPQGIFGAWKLRVTTDAGAALSEDTFTIRANPPTFAAPGSQFSPTATSTDKPINVTLNGNNFDANPVSVTFDKGGASVAVGVIPPNDANHITVSTANVTDPGSYNITVTTAGGKTTSADPFTMNKAKDTKEATKDTKDNKDTKDTKDNKDTKENKDTKDNKENKETKDNKDRKDNKEDTKDHHPKETAKEVETRATIVGPGLPHEATGESDVPAQPPTGQAFISAEERPDVGGNLLQQPGDQTGRG